MLAYRRAAKTLRETPESVVRLSEQGRLVDLPGVGDTIADKVGELSRTAASPRSTSWWRHAAGRRAADADAGDGAEDGQADVRRAGRGDGGRGAQAAATGASATWRGWGEDRAGDPGRARVAPRREAGAGLGRQPAPVRRADRGRAEDAVPGVAECEIAGSLRRYAETAKDIDLVLASDDPGSVADGFAASEWVARWRRAAAPRWPASPTTAPGSSCGSSSRACSGTCSST